MLDVKNLNFKIDGREILKDFSLSVKPGELVVITGPNGSGKSTLAQVLMGIKNPDIGQILLDGQDITKLDIAERAKAGVALSFQQPVHFKGVKVKDLLGVALTGEDTVFAENLDEKAISDALLKVGLKPEEYLDREVNNSLSGGELKRIEVASVLVRKPKLLIFDEPEAGIDIWSFDNLVQIFQDIKAAKTTTLIISHQERLMKIADRIIVIENGKIKADGKFSEVIK
ncbi:MAG: ATP-binding cassette domain-containing protein [Candidatus Saccharibacteria bacterium]|nr:ATP-binding cassette domain-containing protein [Candidatus Saccharibacteria bacterium]